MTKIGAIDDPVWALPALPPVERMDASKNRTERRLMIAAIALVPLLLGYLGWILPSVGGSVVIPTLIVFGIGLLIVIIGCAVAMDRPRWKPFAIGAVIATVLASIWTFQFSLALQIQFSNATAQAKAALQRSYSSQDGIPVCTVQASGSLGPLSAPYRECVSGQMVTFNPVGNQTARLIYADNGSVDLQDACVRPLMGGWTMFTALSDAAACPNGYKFIPGP